jgi:hypothetical protein
MATSPLEPGDFKCPIPRKQTGTPKLKYNLQSWRQGDLKPLLLTEGCKADNKKYFT